MSSGADREWGRVAQNPDNVIVSDSIRSAVLQLLEPEERSVPPSAPVASLLGSSGEITLEVIKFESSARGWIVSGNSLVEDGEKLISVDRETWRAISVSRAGGGELWSRPLNGPDLAVEVQFAPTLDSCTITLTCSRNPEQTRVL